MNKNLRIIYFLLSVFITEQCYATDDTFELFSFESSTFNKTSGVALYSGNTTGRYPINISPHLQSLKVGSNLTIPLPDGSVFQTQVQSIESLAGSGHYATFKGRNGSMLTLSYNSRNVFGIIELNNSIYDITTVQGEGIFLEDRRHPTRKRRNLANDFIHYDETKIKKKVSRESLKLQQSTLSVTRQSSNGVIDILVLYDAGFKAKYQSASELRLTSFFKDVTTMFNNSGVPLTLNIVGIEFINSNLDTTRESLLKMADSVAPFQAVSNLRTSLKADLVALIGVGFTDASGLAFQMDPTGMYQENTGFSVSDDDVTTIAHEIGHNLGSGHARTSVDLSGEGGGCEDNVGFAYSCGHGGPENPQNPMSGFDWGTLMTYHQVSTLVFSNPDLNTCNNGKNACGVRIGSPDAADNRTAFNQSRLIVSEYFPGTSGTSRKFTPAPILLLLLSD